MIPRIVGASVPFCVPLCFVVDGRVACGDADVGDICRKWVIGWRGGLFFASMLGLC